MPANSTRLRYSLHDDLIEWCLAMTIAGRRHSRTLGGLSEGGPIGFHRFRSATRPMRRTPRRSFSTLDDSTTSARAAGLAVSQRRRADR